MSGLVVEKQVHFGRLPRGRKELLQGTDPKPKLSPGRVQRVSRLLALAHRFERLLREGQVRDYAHLARLGHVTRARLSQLMNLLLLAPDVQEAVLHLPRTVRGRDAVLMHTLQPIALEPDWARQRVMWRALAGTGTN